VAISPVRTLAEALDGALASPAGDAVLAEIEAELESATRAAALVGGWSADDPLRLSKTVVMWLLRCPRRALTPSEAGSTDELVAGVCVDAAAKLATLAPQRRPTLDDALAYLAAAGDTTVADHLADPGDVAHDLRADIVARIARLADAWPVVDPAWWPRVEEPVRARLAGGAVLVSGRLDLLLGGPPTGRPAVVVEVKGGRWHDRMRADGHLYALLVALRDGRAPAAVVTVVADGTTEVEPIRPAVLATAAERVEEAVRVAATLAAGEPPAVRPGPHCGHCPVRPDCEPGRAWRADEAAIGSPGAAAVRP
jgi:PD-(D/E)XK nuclease superfamily